MKPSAKIILHSRLDEPREYLTLPPALRYASRHCVTGYIKMPDGKSIRLVNGQPVK